MQGRAASIVDIIDVHVFYLGEVVQWARLISLSSNVQNVCAIDVLREYVRSHLVYHDAY